MIFPAHISRVTAGLAAAPRQLRFTLLLVWGLSWFGLCWWLFLHDLQVQVAGQAPAQALEQKRLDERQAVVQQGQAQLALAQDEKDQLAALEAALPGGPDSESGWAAVHQASRQHGLRMEHFKPGSIGTEKPYPEQRAALRLVGEFDALLAFTRSLASASPFAIESFSLVRRSDQRATGSLSLVLEATLLSLYRPPLAPSAVMPAGAALSAVLTPVDRVRPSLAAAADLPVAQPASPLSLPGAPGDPFASERLAAIHVPHVLSSALADPLLTLPLSGMRMVGSLRMGEQLAALVMAGGTLHAVRVGDKLGNARGQVGEIRSDGLTIQEPGGSGLAKARAINLSLATN